MDFQIETWQAYQEGCSGIVHASTGMGKTYAIWPCALLPYLEAEHNDDPQSQPLRVLWLTPLRALANDLALAMREPLEFFKLPYQVETRTTDTPKGVRAKQKSRLPFALITTPESISIMLSYEDNLAKLSHLDCVVVDEWHELIGNKRGVQVELALARLRQLNPQLKTWGLSATIGNIDEAVDVLCGIGHSPGKRKLIRGNDTKIIEATTLLPDYLEELPWTGHTGLPMARPVASLIESARTALIFTNTRSQTEQWYHRLLDLNPSYIGIAAIHHGSLDNDVRHWVEAALKQERVKFVVATSSLDLGVDFSPVDMVLQIGSPKGVARALQRAGRSGHRPGQISRLHLVPCHALELAELCAARLAMDARQVERRLICRKPLDLLCQHVLTVALGGGFTHHDLYNEVRTTWAYKDLTQDEWQWVLNFVGTGGQALKAYPEYHRMEIVDGVFRVTDRGLALKHRLSIGTIVNDQAMDVVFMRGNRLGQVEESFIARLTKGDTFLFAGRALELVEVKDMKAYVKLSNKKSGPIPRWMGGRMPLSNELAQELRQLIDRASRNDFDEPEMQLLRPLLALQADRSILPRLDQLLVERYKSRDGYHLFVYPFAGRMVNEGLANLIAYHLTNLAPNTFSIAVNDWGFELLSLSPFDFSGCAGDFFKNIDLKDLESDIFACLNSTEMARRQFREIARVSGLIFQGYPYLRKTVKQVQISSSLLFDVFSDFDPGNLLIKQSKDEVLERHLEIGRMRQFIERIAASEICEVDCKKASPFAVPLMVDRLRGKLSTEKVHQRILKMQLELEKDVHAQV